MSGLTFGELVDEAAENAGLDPSALNHRHLTSMTRSLFLVFTEIENKGVKPEYRVSTDTHTLSAGQGAIILPEDTIDILDAAFGETVAGVVSTSLLGRISREGWLGVSDRELPSRPMSFFVSKTLPAEISATYGLADPGGMTERKLLVLYPRNDIAGATVIVNRLRHIGAPTNLASEIDARRNWLDTIQFGLAARTAWKFNPDRYDVLEGKFQSMLLERVQSEDRAPVRVGFRAHGWSRQRRH